MDLDVVVSGIGAKTREKEFGSEWCSTLHGNSEPLLHNLGE